MNRNDKAGIWKGHVHNHTLSESNVSVTVVGTGGPGSISDNVNLQSGQRTPAAISTASTVDVLPEEDRSAIARCERSRELEKLYPSQHLRETRAQTGEQEGPENRGRGADDEGVDDCESHPKPRREHRAKSEYSISSIPSRFITLYLPRGWTLDWGKEVLTQVKMRAGVVVKGQASSVTRLSARYEPSPTGTALPNNISND